MRVLLALLFMTRLVYAEGERAGEFDYYVLSLSWSPNWCAFERDAKGSPQCNEDTKFGWVLHGLWPQNESGWPSYCLTRERDPSRGDTRAMADIMGTPGQAWYQWKKHGRCAGMSSDGYFDAARQAYNAVVRPPVFRKLASPIYVPATVVEQAFLQADPRLLPDMITITCRANRIQEARICLTKDLKPRTCGADIVRDCTLQDAGFLNIK
jgi:ribonuclease T2